ncbi:MAG: hypothetical protein B6244_00565 [Candidatus Cloacimonetes bacterium 4572_55]|nr:MAG: hypothetical protein B6244_00565 [Candidatus Cloacimonetes bacterium 4572_55]
MTLKEESLKDSTFIKFVLILIIILVVLLLTWLRLEIFNEEPAHDIVPGIDEICLTDQIKIENIL